MAEHWCKEHQTVWFKKGNMRGYAHPVLDDDGVQMQNDNGRNIWCNEPTETPPAKPAPVPGKKVEPPEEDRAKPIISGAEKGLWWKEVGENFRAGLFKKDDNANGTKLWNLYIKQMLASLEITLEKEVQPAKDSKLVAEVKKLVPGAKDVTEGGD